MVKLRHVIVSEKECVNVMPATCLSNVTGFKKSVPQWLMFSVSGKEEEGGSPLCERVHGRRVTDRILQ